MYIYPRTHLASYRGTWVRGEPGYEESLGTRGAWVQGEPGYEESLGTRGAWVRGEPGYEADVYYAVYYAVI